MIVTGLKNATEMGRLKGEYGELRVPIEDLDAFLQDGGREVPGGTALFKELNVTVRIRYASIIDVPHYYAYSASFFTTYTELRGLQAEVDRTHCAGTVRTVTYRFFTVPRLLLLPYVNIPLF